ncbi:hypothetical protein HK104_009929 [Borealophlyctis nickersoniae]|nr:hypothetical protein HK104_009929 [Borealophlyctis nickersoniae]
MITAADPTPGTDDSHQHREDTRTRGNNNGRGKAVMNKGDQGQGPQPTKVQAAKRKPEESENHGESKQLENTAVPGQAADSHGPVVDYHTCKKCGGTGHWKWSCPSPHDAISWSEVECYGAKVTLRPSVGYRPMRGRGAYRGSWRGGYGMRGRDYYNGRRQKSQPNENNDEHHQESAPESTQPSTQAASENKGKSREEPSGYTSSYRENAPRQNHIANVKTSLTVGDTSVAESPAQQEKAEQTTAKPKPHGRRGRGFAGRRDERQDQASEATKNVTQTPSSENKTPPKEIQEETNQESENDVKQDVNAGRGRGRGRGRRYYWRGKATRPAYREANTQTSPSKDIAEDSAHRTQVQSSSLAAGQSSQRSSPRKPPQTQRQQEYDEEVDYEQDELSQPEVRSPEADPTGEAAAIAIPHAEAGCIKGRGSLVESTALCLFATPVMK